MNYVQHLRSLVGHQPLILVGAVVVITNDRGEILLQQRRSPYGKWGLPGGLMELEESTEEAAICEVFEETGLRVDHLSLICVLSGKQYFIETQNGDQFYSVTLAYHAGCVEGDLLMDPEESMDLQYFSFANIPPNRVGSHYEILEKFMATTLAK